MYVPAHFSMDDEATRSLLDRHGAADLVTPTAEGLVATMLPFVHDREAGDRGALLGHLARNNPHWSTPPTGRSLAIVRGPDAYVSPSWYASKAEHGRVVPTWNYITVHVHGDLVVHDDPAWLDGLVRRLTDKHEAGIDRSGPADRPSATDRPWSVDDAPERFVAGQLRAIVGIELRITHVEAKAKLSQNRPSADIDGVVAGLTDRGDLPSAHAVERARPR